MSFTVRQSNHDDSESINRIANWYISHTAVNFDTEPWTLEKRTEWLKQFNSPGSPYYLLVGETKEGIVGFSCNTRFRPKAAYDSSTETTVYIDHSIQPEGRGGKLYAALMDKILNENFHRAYAVVTLPNPASVVLHERFGFSRIGTFDEIGYKFGKYHSVVMFEKKLGS